MERQQAADFLGVSLSTLDRLASQGRLTRGRARKKTRPVTVYDRPELERLKAELEQTKPAELSRNQVAQKPQDAVAFRLDPHYVKRLAEEGQKEGKSAGEYARTLVIQGLEGSREKRLAEDLSFLREGLAEMFFLVLTQKMGATPDEASDLVASVLRRG